MNVRKGDTDGSQKLPRKQDRVGKRGQADFRGYINLVLAEDEKSAWLAWSTTPDIWEVLTAQVALGINFSVKSDPRGEGALASATQRDASSPNAGLCVTARGKTADVALSRVVYSVIILSGTEIWEDTQQMADPDRW